MMTLPESLQLMGPSEETMLQVHLQMNEASQPIRCEPHALKTQADCDWHCTLIPLLVNAMSHEICGSVDN